MDDTEQNKSEQPTSFKLDRARRKGSVARGMDLGFLTALAAFLGYAWIFGRSLQEQIGQSARGALVAAPNVLGSPNELMAVTGMVLSHAARPLALMAGAIFLVVLTFEVFQTGFIFTTEPLRLDFGRLSPAKGLKRLFTVKLLIETAKNILKLIVYVAITYAVIRHAQKSSLAAITDAGSLAAAMTATGFKLLAFYVIAAIGFAAADQLISRRDFMKKMRMSRREVRRESRDREGEPRMKQRRKQLHAEFVKLSSSLRNVRGADVLITNPSHYAVALKYDRGAMEAPTIVSRGANQFALRLKQAAFVYGVTVVEDRQLARSLYFKCEMNREIPDAYFRRVADIYLSIRERSGQARSEAVDA